MPYKMSLEAQLRKDLERFASEQDKRAAAARKAMAALEEPGAVKPARKRGRPKANLS